VDQECKPERLTGLVLRRPPCRQLAQLVAAQRQQPAGRMRIAVVEGV
jgi:hypothetical protein